MYSYGDLVKKFNEYCGHIATVFPEMVKDMAKPDTQSIVTVTENMDFMDVWWTPANKNDFLMQQMILRVNDPKALERMTGLGVFDLRQNEDHFTFFKEQMAIAHEKKLEDFFYDRYLPHEIGVNGCGYGSDLRNTDGFKQLDFMCKAMGNTDILIRFTNDPQTPDLTKSFHLAIEIQSTNGVPLKNKMGQSHMKQFFDLNKLRPN